MARSSTQSGNVFFIILLAIFMMAALCYAVFQGSRTGASSLSGDQARLAAQEIMAYGDIIQKAVQTLRLRGCSENEISFQQGIGNASASLDGTPYDYTNPSAPTDGSCDVFSPNGGKVKAQRIATGYTTPGSLPNNAMAPDSFVITTTKLAGIGSDAKSDLLLWIGRVKPEVCMKINDIVGQQNQSAEPPIDTFDCDSAFFKGTYDDSCSNLLGDGFVVTKGKSAFCSGYSNTGEYYNYFVVLLAR